MIILLTFRRFHGPRRDGMTCRQRREARREARRLRKAAKAEGSVKLEGVENQFVNKVDEKVQEVVEESLPSYEEGEGDRLVVVVKGQDQA